MIHLYAFVDGLRDLPATPGLDGAPVEVARTGSLTVAVSRHPGPVAVSRHEGALAHAFVVEELLTLTESVLPARFGETFADDGELAEAVAPREESLRDALARVCGCVELGVRIATRPVVTTGRGYLEARLRETSAASELDAALALFSRDALTTGTGERVHLVARADAPDARDAVAAFAERRPDAVVTCSGPWAPYTFGGAVR